MKHNKLNSYINYLIDNELKGKKNVIRYKYLNDYLNEQIGEDEYIEFNDIKFKKIIYGKTKARFSFGFTGKDETIKEFYFYHIENNKNIEKQLSTKNGIDYELVKAIQRLITGVLLGYECLMFLDGDYEKLVRRDFNQYLIWIKNNICIKNVYNEQIFTKRFILQTADTKENMFAISKIDYGMIDQDKKRKWGLKLKNESIFISEFVLGYLDKEIYKYLEMDDEVQITYNEYAQMCYLIFAIIKSFEFENG